MYCFKGLRMTDTSTAHTLSTPTALASATQAASSVQTLAPGQSIWLYLESGSTLYCQAGQVRVHALWLYDLVLRAEDAPYYNGAHAGWHQVEVLSAQPATLCTTLPPQSLWHNTWRAVCEWLGCTPRHS